MARANVQFSLPQSPVYRYGLAIASFLLCSALAIGLDYIGFRKIEAPLLLFGIAVTAWYAGSGPAALSVVLSILLFDYYFVQPRYSFLITASEIPYFLIIASFASLIAWFSNVRRGVEKDLREARDNLELEVAERTRQASLLNLTHDTIFVRDMNAVITYWNRGAEELYGFTAEQAVGKRTHDLLQTVFPLPYEEVRAELLKDGRWEGELRHTKADGSAVIVSSRWSLQSDLDGRPLAILETNNDITERKRREDQIESLNLQLATRSSELESINKELEAFAYSVSHDLRAPLRHIGGYTELLQKQISSIVNEKANRYMATILDSAKRMGNLIDDLLAFSRIGRAETQKTQVNLDQLVKEALSEVRQDAEGRQIAWRIGALPPFWGDRSMLRLVLVNLLSNAVKFTRTRPNAEIEVGVANGTVDEQIIFVRDNGVGFDMKYAGKLFGVFQRLHQSDVFEGTGIGLATVQRIIHRHGGRVWAEGAINEGATFYFSAPKPQGQLWKT
jgi:PAS domain S-box-containing protein